MATELTIKKGRGTPKDSDLVEAELAIDVDLGTLYSKLADGTIAALNEGGGGAGMVISATEPANPVTGMQWLESTTADVWIWDDDKWLQFPASGGGYETNSVDGGSASSIYLPDQVIDGGGAAR
jgi:hypothetical protein